MSPILAIFLSVSLILVLLAVAPALLLIVVVGVCMLVADHIRDSRFLAHLSYYVAVIRGRLFDEVMLLALRGEGVIANVRYAIRMYQSREEMLGIRSNLQEIHEIVHRVERGEWLPEIGDPFDHVKYEAKKGMVATGSLLYGPD